MRSTLTVKSLQVGQMQTNVYIVTDTKSNETLIIDPGDDTDYLTTTISDAGLKPIALLATHGHFDHVLAISELALIYKVPFLLHKADEFLLSRMQSSAHHFLGTHVETHIPKVSRYIDQNDRVAVGTFTFSVLHTPGHTPGSICLYNKVANILFSGDTLFADGGVGRTDFQYSSAEKLQASLKTIFALPPETALYPGHGSTSMLEAELKYFHDSKLA